MMKRFVAGLLVFVAGFIAAFLLMSYYSSWQAEEETDVPLSPIRVTTEVPAGAPTPTLELAVMVDGTDGYNVNVKTTNFTFTPGLVGESVGSNTGYATLYVNGRLKERLYGPWIHVGYEDLSNGLNTIDVVLVANDGAEWAVNGEIISSSAVLEKVRPK